MKSTANVLHNGLHKRQGGGTFLGIILGLIIGLGIAVVVAMMITKTPTPFTNKLGLTKSTDAPAIQLTDPNKPLYGSSAKEVMANANRPVDTAAASVLPPAAVTAAATPEVAVRPPDPVKSESRPEIRPESKPEAKPDSKPEIKVAKAAEPSAAASSGQVYYLQVGAFRDVADADSARAKLALIGVEARVSSSADGDNLHRVRIGPFDRLETMNSMRSKLSENSIDVAVIKTPK